MTDLKTIRINLGLSRAELAVKAQVGLSSVIRAEQGKPVRRIILAKICRVLNVKIEEVEDIHIID